MKVTFIGADHEVTGSCTHLDICGKHILIDYGMEQGKDFFQNAPLPELPDQIALPANAKPAAVTFARDWVVVVTETGEVLLYDRQGRLKDRVQP